EFKKFKWTSDSKKFEYSYLVDLSDKKDNSFILINKNDSTSIDEKEIKRSDMNVIKKYILNNN
ncbi:MAG: hypothetical protein MUF43_13135, partial [Flavobacterium sp.]|nr:hypothetical protein [Flavobacterium sp.]